MSIQKQVGYISGKEYLELVSPDLIQHIIDSGLCSENYDLTNYSQKVASQIYANETAQLQSYAKKYKKSDKGISVKYNKAKHAFGRVFPLKSLGLTSLVKKTRNTLIKDHMIDLDLSNAQPSIILNLSKANGIPCPFNDQYINNREEVLTNIIALYGVTRNDAKGLFIRLAFSGTFRGWCMDAGLDPEVFEPSEFVKGFTAEIYDFAKLVKDANPELYKCVKDNKTLKGEDRNILGATLALYLQEYEFRIVDCIINFLDNKTKITTVPFSKLKVLTYEFDGIKLLRAKVLEYGSVDFLINTIETYVFEKLGFVIKLEEKAIEKFFAIERVFIPELTSELTKDELKQQQIILKKEEDKTLLESKFCDVKENHQLPSGKIAMYLYTMFDAVSNDLQAVEKLYVLYPQFVLCQGELYVFCFENGLYSND